MNAAITCYHECCQQLSAVLSLNLWLPKTTDWNIEWKDQYFLKCFKIAFRLIKRTNCSHTWMEIQLGGVNDLSKECIGPDSRTNIDHLIMKYCAMDTWTGNTVKILNHVNCVIVCSAPELEYFSNFIVIKIKHYTLFTKIYNNHVATRTTHA